MIYLVYECNSQREIKSIVVKMMNTSLPLAERVYKQMAKSYENDEDYFLNLSVYEPNLKATEESNVLRELEILKTTENE